MAESPKALRQLLLASVRGLTVTRLESAGPDALVLDAGVVAAAGLVPFEKLEVQNLTSGARFATCLMVSRKAPGGVEVSGPAVHFAAVGDVLVVSAWAWVKGKAAAKHEPRVVSVDARNRVSPLRARVADVGSSETPTGSSAPGEATAPRGR